MSPPTASLSPPIKAPAPARLRLMALLCALAAGPAAWSTQLIVGYGLSSRACYPNAVPLRQAPPGGWSAEPWVLLTINLACFGLALAGATAAWRQWRAARGDEAAPAEQRRTRFLAACALMASAGFGLAVLFDTPVILDVPTCWSLG